MKITEYLEKSPLFLALEVQEVIHQKLGKVLKEEGVNFLQALILISLFLERSNNISPSDLAKNLKSSKASIGQSLSFLESEGFVFRKVKSHDARFFSIQLGEEGMDKARKLIGLINHVEVSLEKELGKPQVSQLVDQLGGFKKGLSKFGLFSLNSN